MSPGKPAKPSRRSASHLSSKDIPVNERLILALDVPTAAEAKSLVRTLGKHVVFYKLGLQLCMSGDYFTLLRWLQKRGKKVFVDLKFFDVPETVKNAVQQLQKWNVQFATVHGNDEILKAALFQKKFQKLSQKESQKDGFKILAVTVLTSLDRADMNDLGFKADVGKVVLSRARRALRLGCDGVISSGLEAPMLRRNLGDRFLVVTPGIRPVDNTEVSAGQPLHQGKARTKKDDQKRVTTVEEAFGNGADYIVVGRPILKASDPRAAAIAIQKQIATLFSGASGRATA